MNLFSKFIFQVFLICILTFNTFKQSSAQKGILDNPQTLKFVKDGVDSIYNGNFIYANKVYTKILEDYPNHPIPFIFKGLIIYWENFPLIPSSKYAKEFENYLYKALELSDRSIKKDENNPEIILSGIASSGLLLLYFSDNALTAKVISLLQTNYEYSSKSNKWKEKFYDFYFNSGLYNYYREAYPEAHPFYKPFVVFFPSGNKKTGLKELNIAANRSIFFKAESYSFLNTIYSSFELNNRLAVDNSHRLLKLYPNNAFYTCMHVRNLLLLNQFDSAEKLIKFQINIPSTNKFIPALLDIYKGIIFEKKYKLYNKSEDFYLKGINNISDYGDYANDPVSYAYFGLSRIYMKKGDAKTSKKYQKLARDFSSYKHINFND